MARSRNHNSASKTAPAPARSRGLIMALGTIIALLIVGIMLYGPFCDWYAAWRDNVRLQEDYGKTLDEQLELQGDVDRLRTREGIEDEAHRKGYGYDDETRVVVENLPEDKTTADAAPEERPEDPWYLQLMDTIFGYEG